MEKKKNKIGNYIIGSAIIWGAVLIGCAFKLKGTGCFDEIALILSSGAGIHLLIIWVPLAVQIKKHKEEHKSKDKQQ